MELLSTENRILSTDDRATALNSREDMSEKRVKEIQEMSRDDLIQIIIRGNVPFLEEASLKNQETEVLRRLTFLAINHSNDLA